ncbi:hypothetical protein EV356DRAFT_509911 [Viridothelium virens]|uniref:Uncharacterized protein n=1 Tax=Viridothelium virens TaxID=1048519 RepID=A0A6A6GW01_VIRVR|nr:hypothetical protein EV356DRAFT_509911 [Viridothelium virens]
MIHHRPPPSSTTIIIQHHQAPFVINLPSCLDQPNTQIVKFRPPNMQSSMDSHIMDYLQDRMTRLFTHCSVNGTVYLGLLEREDVSPGAVTYFTREALPTLAKRPASDEGHFTGLTNGEIVNLLTNFTRLSSVRIFDESNGSSAWFWGTDTYRALVQKLALHDPASTWARAHERIARDGWTVDVLKSIMNKIAQGSHWETMRGMNIEHPARICQQYFDLFNGVACWGALIRLQNNRHPSMTPEALKLIGEGQAHLKSFGTIPEPVEPGQEASAVLTMTMIPIKSCLSVDDLKHWESTNMAILQAICVDLFTTYKQSILFEGFKE